MYRETRLVISHRPYAVNLDSLHWETPNWGRIDAVWFRRRRGITVACIGYLSGRQDTSTTDPRGFLARHDDGRYGGQCEGRWDGTRYWGTQDLDVMQQHLAVLRPMLAHYPDVPPGYDGWWRF